MTELENSLKKSQERLTFLNYLADSFPRGTKFGLLVLGVIGLFNAILLLLVLSKQLDMESVRAESIKRSKNTAAEVHAINLKVDSLASNQDKIRIDQKTILYKQAQAETRGIFIINILDSLNRKQSIKKNLP